MRKLKGKRVSKKTGYRMEMKGYSCEVKDDGGSFRERKYEKQRRYGGGGGREKRCTRLQVEVPCERTVKSMW